MATVGRRPALDLLSGRNLSTANGISQLAQHNRSLESTISLLNYELYVANLKKDNLPRITHYLLQIFLKLFGESSECRRGHFFSFTETSTEYSIISDKELLQVLIPDEKDVVVEVTECKWRPLVVEVGALGSVTGISNIATTVIAPLADWGVSVFCLSTNLEDYVMVKENHLKRALTCLSRRFKVVCDAENEGDMSLVKTVLLQQSSVDSPISKRVGHSGKVLLPENMPCPLVHPYSCSENHYVLCGVNPASLPTIGTSLLHLMLFNQQSSSEEGFLSFSVVEEDVSLVMGSDHMYRFPENALYVNKDTWRLIRIGEGPLGFDICGIVAQVSSPLAAANISSCYICTFSTDHTLVPESSVKEALHLLNECYVNKLLNKQYNGKALTGLATTQSSSSEQPLAATDRNQTALDLAS